MRNKTKLPIILIGIILLILFLNHFMGIDEAENKEKSPERSNASSIEHPEINVDDALFRVELEENYYFHKDMNYYLMSFFEGVNSNDLDMDLMNEEYLEFMQLDKEKIMSAFEKMESVDYDVLSYEKIKDSYVIHLNYRDIGEDQRFLKSFSIIGTTMTDRSFVEILDIGAITESEIYKIEVKSKGVFDKYEIYKIEVENKSENDLIIDDSMYGFNAIKGDSKYYHTLESAKLPYEIVPGEIRSFLIRFDTHNPKEIYVTIDGEETKIY